MKIITFNKTQAPSIFKTTIEHLATLTHTELKKHKAKSGDIILIETPTGGFDTRFIRANHDKKLILTLPILRKAPVQYKQGFQIAPRDVKKSKEFTLTIDHLGGTR